MKKFFKRVLTGVAVYFAIAFILSIVDYARAEEYFNDYDLQFSFDDAYINGQSINSVRPSNELFYNGVYWYLFNNSYSSAFLRNTQTQNINRIFFEFVSGNYLQYRHFSVTAHLKYFNDNSFGNGLEFKSKYVTSISYGGSVYFSSFEDANGYLHFFIPFNNWINNSVTFHFDVIGVDYKRLVGSWGLLVECLGWSEPPEPPAYEYWFDGPYEQQELGLVIKEPELSNVEYFDLAGIASKLQRVYNNISGLVNLISYPNINFLDSSRTDVNITDTQVHNSIVGYEGNLPTLNISAIQIGNSLLLKNRWIGTGNLYKYTLKGSEFYLQLLSEQEGYFTFESKYIDRVEINGQSMLYYGGQIPYHSGDDIKLYFTGTTFTAKDFMYEGSDSIYNYVRLIDNFSFMRHNFIDIPSGGLEPITPSPVPTDVPIPTDIPTIHPPSVPDSNTDNLLTILINNIKNLPVRIVEGIGKLLQYLFIPKDFTGLMVQTGEKMESGLGFLGFPLKMVGDIFEEYQNGQDLQEEAYARAGLSMDYQTHYNRVFEFELPDIEIFGYKVFKGRETHTGGQLHYVNSYEIDFNDMFDFDLRNIFSKLLLFFGLLAMAYDGFTSIFHKGGDLT